MQDLWNWFVAVAVPTDAEGFWALVSAVLGVALLWAAVKGLQSLKLTREGMLNDAKREARACAIRRCEEFANDIIPLNAPIVNAFAALRVPVFVTDASGVQFDPDPLDQVPLAGEWFERLPPETRSQCIVLLNRLEAWAMYFTNQLADAQIAFGPCGPYYCSRVVQLYPCLLIHRNADESSGRYPNLVTLFKEWIAELEEEERGLQEGHLLEKLRELQTKGSPRKTIKPPLGTQLDL